MELCGKHRIYELWATANLEIYENIFIIQKIVHIA